MFDTCVYLYVSLCIFVYLCVSPCISMYLCAPLGHSCSQGGRLEHSQHLWAQRGGSPRTPDYHYCDYYVWLSWLLPSTHKGQRVTITISTATILIILNYPHSALCITKMGFWQVHLFSCFFALLSLISPPPPTPPHRRGRNMNENALFATFALSPFISGASHRRGERARRDASL